MSLCAGFMASQMPQGYDLTGQHLCGQVSAAHADMCRLAKRFVCKLVTWAALARQQAGAQSTYMPEPAHLGIWVITLKICTASGGHTSHRETA